MELFNVQEVASFWRVQPELVQAHVDAGRLRGINLGIAEPQVRFHPDDIADCLKILRGRSGGEPAAASTIRPRLSLPGVYRLNIKSSAEEGIDPGEFCLREGVAGMGWGVKTDSPLDWDQYRQLATAQHPRGDWLRPVTTLHDAPYHSVIWTRRGNGRDTRFSLGLVVGPWEYRNDEQADMADIVNIRPVIWHEVGGYDAVPKSIKNAFTPITCAPIKQQEAIEFTEVLASQLISDGIWEEIA
jgi:hypothetical protein